MKKNGTDTKTAKSSDPFVESENSFENQALGFIKSSEMLKTEEVLTFTEKPNSFLNLTKQVFLFLPGTFLLYLISFIGTIILIETRSVQEPVEIFGIRSAPIQILLFGIIALFGTFMT